MPKAIAEALEFAKQPHNVVQLKLRRLPEDILILLRTVGGDETAFAAWPAEYVGKPDKCRDIAAQYLMGVLFQGKDDPLRMLALPATYDDETLKEHKRLFLKWLHPDGNSNTDENKHFSAVMSAIKLVQAGYKPKPAEPIKPAAQTATSNRAPSSRLKQMSVVQRAAQEARTRKPPPALRKFAASRRRVAFHQDAPTLARRFTKLGWVLSGMALSLALLFYYYDILGIARP
jgi:hypothetical protein